VSPVFSVYSVDFMLLSFWANKDCP